MFRESATQVENEKLAREVKYSQCAEAALNATV
jgi:hypothetical protein